MRGRGILSPSLLSEKDPPISPFLKRIRFPLPFKIGVLFLPFLRAASLRVRENYMTLFLIMRVCNFSLFFPRPSPLNNCPIVRHLLLLSQKVVKFSLFPSLRAGPLFFTGTLRLLLLDGERRSASFLPKGLRFFFRPVLQISIRTF